MPSRLTWLDGGRKVDAKKNAILEKVNLVDEACQAALKPWLKKIKDEQDAEAERLRKEADEAAKIAREAHIAASGNIESLIQAESLIKVAKTAEKIATKAEKTVAKVSGGIGRAATLQTINVPVMLNFSAALDHYVATRIGDVKAFIQSLAEADAKAGKQKIPGFVMAEEEKVA